MALPAGDILDLLDWKRRIFELYALVRQADDPAEAWLEWRTVRDEMFAGHPQSPIPDADRGGFTSLPYFDYDAKYRTLATVEPADPSHFDIAASGEDPGATYGFTRFATARFELSGGEHRLDLFWLEGYGGGLFLPFRDGMSGRDTYGAGRYLLDTVKGSDLGSNAAGRLVLDFNFAYNPSCSYDPRWVCPLAPPGNRLQIDIPGGERVPWKEPAP